MLFRQIIRYFATVMKRPFYISLLLCCAIGSVSCTGPVIVEEEEEKTEIKDEGESPNEEVHERDSVAIIHEGTYASPYTVGEAQTLGRGKSVWIEGYIVGSVSGSMKSGCDYTAEAVTASNILLADTFPTGSEYDYLYCMPVELPNGSIERDVLNLRYNPMNYQRKVRLSGDIEDYFKVAGVKNIDGYMFCDEITDDPVEEETDGNEGENGEKSEEEPDGPYDPNATRNDTLSIAEGIKLQSEDEYNQVYIRGYIIGYTTSNKKIYYDFTDIKEASARSNVILADHIEEQNPDNMIAVELKNGSYIQKSINLFDNPENLHKLLTVKGRMYTCKSLNGCIDIPNGYTPPGDTIVVKDYYYSLE